MMLIPCRVAPSPIHGLGLWTVAPVPKGSPIWRFVPGFDREFTPEQSAALPPVAREHLRWFGYIDPSYRTIILSGDHACFMNHGDQSNTGVTAEAVSPVTTVALRDLMAGEELTCNYFSFDADAAWKLQGGSRT